MKRWLCWLLLLGGVVLLLWIPHVPVGPHLHRQAVADRSVLSHSEFVSTWYRALPAASAAFSRNRDGPREFFATRSAFLITRDDGPPWLYYRWPPGANACSQDFDTDCKAASKVSSPSWKTFQQHSGRIQN